MKKYFLVFMLFALSIFLQAQTYSHLVYAIADVGSPRGFCKLDLDDVTNHEILYEQEGWDTEWFSSTWMNGEWLAIKYFGDLYKVDTETGIPTSIVSITPGANSLLGLTYDPVSSNLYANDVEKLYTIDVNTGEITTVGNLGAPFGFGGMFGLSCDHLGNLYGLNTLDDNLYSIDPNTGVATIIGPLGINPEYFISLIYDQQEHVMYANGLGDANTQTYGLFKVNLSDGSLALYQEYSDPLEFRTNSIAIPYDESVNIEKNYMQKVDVTLYPNPANNLVNIQTTLNTEKVQLVNLAGQVLVEKTTFGTKTEINTTRVSPGTYFVKVFSTNNVITRKLVIE